MDAYLQELLESPIDNAARANRIWLPNGKTRAPRSAKPEYHGDELPKLTPKQVRERARTQLDTKKAQLLAYYAKTRASAEVVAGYVGIPVEETARRLHELRSITQ